jgi:hypothetical protein
MAEPYIPAEDRIDVIGRLTARLDDEGSETLREQAEARAEAASASDPLMPLKPVKDEGEKDDKDFQGRGPEGRGEGREGVQGRRREGPERHQGGR